MKTFIFGFAIGAATTVACVHTLQVVGRTIGQTANAIQELYGDKFAQRIYSELDNG
jgi:predicted small secreted protein